MCTPILSYNVSIWHEEHLCTNSAHIKTQCFSDGDGPLLVHIVDPGYCKAVRHSWATASDIWPLTICHLVLQNNSNADRFGTSRYKEWEDCGTLLKDKNFEDSINNQQEINHNVWKASMHYVDRLALHLVQLHVLCQFKSFKSAFESVHLSCNLFAL